MTPVIDITPRALDDDAERPQLERSWRQLPGVRGWFSVTVHQTLGLRYIVTAFCFLLAGGAEALLMRPQSG
jgi:heme/copper-type cytochrome/quinol oxidase subunit 1